MSSREKLELEEAWSRSKTKWVTDRLTFFRHSDEKWENPYWVDLP